MFTAREAKEVTSSNKNKLDLFRNLMLSYVISRIQEAANKGLSTLELEVSNPKNTDATYNDYCYCVYNLRLAGYKVRHLKDRIYISW